MNAKCRCLLIFIVIFCRNIIKAIIKKDGIEYLRDRNTNKTLFLKLMENEHGNFVTILILEINSLRYTCLLQTLHIKF